MWKPTGIICEFLQLIFLVMFPRLGLFLSIVVPKYLQQLRTKNPVPAHATFFCEGLTLKCRFAWRKSVPIAQKTNLKVQHQYISLFTDMTCSFFLQFIFSDRIRAVAEIVAAWHWRSCLAYGSSLHGFNKWWQSARFIAYNMILDLT
jgi:hypothetical protein